MRGIRLSAVTTILVIGACRNTSPETATRSPAPDAIASPVEAAALATSDASPSTLDAGIVDSAASDASALLDGRSHDGPLQDLAIEAALPAYWRALHGSHPPSAVPSTFVVGSLSLDPSHARFSCWSIQGEKLLSERELFCKIVARRPIVNVHAHGARVRDVEAYNFGPGREMQADHAGVVLRPPVQNDAWPALVVSEVLRDPSSGDAIVFVDCHGRGFAVGFCVRLQRRGANWKATNVDMTFIT